MHIEVSFHTLYENLCAEEQKVLVINTKGQKIQNRYLKCSIKENQEKLSVLLKKYDKRNMELHDKKKRVLSCSKGVLRICSTSM